jgi:hypothetical protein
MADREYRLRINYLSDLVCVKACDKRLLKEWSHLIFDIDKTADNWKLEDNNVIRKGKY